MDEFLGFIGVFFLVWGFGFLWVLSDTRKADKTLMVGTIIACFGLSAVFLYASQQL